LLFGVAVEDAEDDSDVGEGATTAGATADDILCGYCLSVSRVFLNVKSSNICTLRTIT
jgi:hypothetical protein